MKENLFLHEFQLTVFEPNQLHYNTILLVEDSCVLAASSLLIGRLISCNSYDWLETAAAAAVVCCDWLETAAVVAVVCCDWLRQV